MGGRTDQGAGRRPYGSGRRGTRLAYAGALLLVAATARAELYSYTDAAGAVHFTNLPPGHGRPDTWRDAAGQPQRLHLVDVTAFDPLLREAAAYYSLPPALLKAVVAVESAFVPAAVSPSGAQGLMQLMPATARAMAVDDPLDPSDNVFGGSRYLRILANRFDGDLRLTLAAYNAGPEAVERVGGVPAIVQTRGYVRRVLLLYRHYLLADVAPSAGASCD